MKGEIGRSHALRACGLIEPGLEPAFDRIARLAVLSTRAPVCVVVFGDDALVKGHSGPGDTASAPREFHAELLDDRSPPFASRDDLAGAVIRDPDGIKVGSICVRTMAARTWTPEALAALTDFAELARSELAVRARRPPDERTTMILESVSDACVFLDRAWRYVFVNKRAGEIFGRHPADLIGKHIWTEFPEGVGQRFYHAYQQAMRDQIPGRLEEYYPPWNRWFENRIYPSEEGLAIFFQDVTERRGAALERQRLSDIIETETDLVAISSAEGEILYLNPAGRRLLGLPVGEPLPPLHMVRLHAPSSRDVICDAMPLAAGGQPWSGEVSLVAASGEKIQVSETLTWHRAEAPDSGFFSIVGRDLTERIRFTQERERDAIFKTQAESLAHLGYWSWDIATNRVTWSAELYRTYGLDRASFPASFEGYLGRLHPADRDRVRAVIERALSEHSPFTFEERIVRPDGEIRQLRSWGSVNTDADGHPTELFGTCLDITEMVQATEELRRAEEWLRAALRNARAVVCEWSVHTNEVRFSEDASDVLGIPAEELGASFDAYLNFLHPDDRAPFMEALRACANSGSDVDTEHRLVVAGSPVRWIATRGRAQRGSGDRVERLLGTMLDVTERHRIEDERRHLVEKLAHAQKMDAIGRLSAEIAHDFNNHLTIIQSSVDQMMHSPNLDAVGQSGVRNVEEAVRSCAVLTGQLLSFSRNQTRPLRVAQLDLAAVVEQSCRFLRRLLPGNVTLELALAPGLRPVMGDREQLERVLLNLIVNARDAMPNGGRLQITTRENEGGAILEVRDDGIGMTPEVKERAFEPFFTTKEPGRGTGLGLSTVYGIVSQSGGAIDVESAPGEGTVFTVRLPFAS